MDFNSIFIELYLIWKSSPWSTLGLQRVFHNIFLVYMLFNNLDSFFNEFYIAAINADITLNCFLHEKKSHSTWPHGQNWTLNIDNYLQD